MLRRVRAAQAGLAPLLAEARVTWAARAGEGPNAGGPHGGGGADTPDATPGWRAFEDAFPTFYQFTNRPR
jgi:hypothetical protein